MPDLLDLFKKWWKQIVLVVVLSVLVVGVITFLKPTQYLAIATSVPASSFAADRSKIFNENIQALYSTLGTPDDLDMIVGTAQLDTVYLAVTDRFNLFDHYKVSEQGNAARKKSASLLKKNSRVMKSEYGELKVKVWDTDKNLAPQLANSIMDVLQLIHQDLQSEGNRSAREGLKTAIATTRARIDSIRVSGKSTDTVDELTRQLAGYEKLFNEYDLLLNTKPPVLVAVEKATSPEWPDRPKKLRILVATAFLALLFSIIAAMVMEGRKSTRP